MFHIIGQKPAPVSANRVAAISDQTDTADEGGPKPILARDVRVGLAPAESSLVPSRHLNSPPYYPC